MTQHYLDHAATTPPTAAAIAAMTEQLATVGNPSSLHSAGRSARRVVEESRERIAAALGARPSEVIFTSGGTESDNLAITGSYRGRRDQDQGRSRVVVSAVEHHAVLDSAEHLEKREDAEVTVVAVDGAARVSPGALAEALGDGSDVAVASIMWANNEVGTVQDIPALAAVARERGVPFHTDAVQAVGQVPVDFGASGADLLTVTGHKLGGPVGVGALLARRDVVLEPLLHGGGQERGVRSGTLDAPGIVGLAVALEAAVARREDESARVMGLRDELIEGAMALGLGIRPGGEWTRGDRTRRLPGNAHLLVPGCEGDSLLYLLDAAGILCSTGSACTAGVPQPSHVLLAMGLPPEEARGTLRLTLGHTSHRADVEAVLTALPAAVERARRATGQT